MSTPSHFLRWTCCFVFVALCATAVNAASADSPAQLVTSARGQIGVTTLYDPAYRQIAYPNGDVPNDRGVCTDVLVRAFRAQGIDLQKEVHLDMRQHFAAYPKHWKLSRPDPNIDHRRVPNLMTYFSRRGFARPIGSKTKNFLPGDIVAWDLGGGLSHIGIISDRSSLTKTPLVIHNIGRGVREENILFDYRIIGHYRVDTEKLPRRS